MSYPAMTTIPWGERKARTQGEAAEPARRTIAEQFCFDSERASRAKGVAQFQVP
jgi:hypothetical protein